MNRNNKSKTVAFLGIFFAVAMILNYVEAVTPTAAFLPPGVKLGLSNIVTMYCLFFLGAKYAVMMSSFKSFFVFLTRGFTAGLLSFSGGISSVVVMIIVMLVTRKKASYLILSVFGAVSHNVAQIIVASLITNTPLIAYYLPVLIVSGVMAGSVTSVILNVFLTRVDFLKDMAENVRGKQ